jgi:hypothetical protein
MPRLDGYKAISNLSLKEKVLSGIIKDFLE